MYSLLLAIIYVAFVSLGLPDSLVGAGWPVMHEDLGVPVGWAGFITMIIAGGTIVSSLASERLTHRFGTGVITVVSVGMTAAALLGFSISTSFWMLLLWAIPYGLGAGAVDAALNNYVALHYAARHMNWLHSFWGVGASISPFIMSYAITANLGWPKAYWVVGIIQGVLTFALIVTLPVWRKVNQSVPSGVESGAEPAAQGQTAGEHAAGELAEGELAVGGLAEGEPASDELANGEQAKPVPLSAVFRIPGVVLILLAFFAYCALESTSFLWASTYLVNVRGVDVAIGAAFSSLYLLGITGGRFLTGFFADRIGDRNLIRGGFGLVLVGAGLVALPGGSEILALVGLAVAGLGSAPIYPAIIHSTPANFGRRNSQAIIGVQMAAAYTGSTLAPPLFGAISTWAGLWLFPIYLGAFAVLGLVMSERLNGLSRRRQAAK